MPEWMRPDLCGTIVTIRQINDISYVEALEVDGVMRAEVLSFLIMSKLEGRFDNISYEIKGGKNFIGTDEFLQAMSSRHA